MVNLWLAGGFPKSKLVVGLPTYGHSWAVKHTDPGVPFVGSDGRGNGTVSIPLPLCGPLM